MLTLTSPAFEHMADIPTQYTCEGEDVSPPLQIAHVSPKAKSLVLIVDDPDAPDPKAPKMIWNHWLLFNLPPDIISIAEGNAYLGTLGKNSWGHLKYGGPCPPIGKHRYFFKLYALNKMLDLEPGVSRAKLEAAMQDHIIDKAELIGLYEKQQ